MTKEDLTYPSDSAWGQAEPIAQRQQVRVAVGVLIDTAERVLIAQRTAAAHQGGLWEFPGGKVELGETTPIALARELTEELGITVMESEQLMTVSHDYGDKQVLLDVYQVTQWVGEPHGLEGQPLAWVKPAQLADYNFPAGNQSLVAHLSLGQDAKC